MVGLALVLAACALGEPAEPQESDYKPAAAEFATEADRALDGTRFAAVAVVELADAIVELCLAGGSVEAAIDGFAAPPGDPGDDAIMREVLVAGVVQVCPALSADADAVDAYLSSVRSAIQAAGVDLVLDDEPLLAAGTLVCASLDAGQGVEGAILAAVAILYGLEASSVDDLDAVIDGPQGVAVGATLAAAASLLCPQYQDDVTEFVDAE